MGMEEAPEEAPLPRLSHLKEAVDSNIAREAESSSSSSGSENLVSDWSECSSDSELEDPDLAEAEAAEVLAIHRRFADLSQKRKSARTLLPSPTLAARTLLAKFGLAVSSRDRSDIVATAAPDIVVARTKIIANTSVKTTCKLHPKCYLWVSSTPTRISEAMH
jgi:hypothetical protein